MCTSSLPLAVEKKKVAEIQQLKKQKPQINAQAEKLEGLKAKEQEMQESTVFTNIKEQIDNVTAKCEVVWKAKEPVKAEYSKLVDEQKKIRKRRNWRRKERIFKRRLMILLESEMICVKRCKMKNRHTLSTWLNNAEFSKKNARKREKSDVKRMKNETFNESRMN